MILFWVRLSIITILYLHLVGWDHNNIVSIFSAFLCDPKCIFTVTSRPILRPSCHDNRWPGYIHGRVLNDDSSWEAYLGYVKEFVGVLDSGLLEHFRSYGYKIKGFVKDDPLFSYQSEEEYEIAELDTKSEFMKISPITNTPITPLLRTLSVRINEVKAQLEANEAGTLLKNDEYGSDEVCPAWRMRDPPVVPPDDPSSASTIHARAFIFIVGIAVLAFL